MLNLSLVVLGKSGELWMFTQYTVGAVFKSADSIELNSFLLRIVLQRGFYCSEDSIALSHNCMYVKSHCITRMLSLLQHEGELY